MSSANPAYAVIVTLMGVAYTTNHGNSWSQGTSPSGIADKAMVVSDTSGNFYVGTGYAGPVAKSTNNGASWTTQSGSIYSSSTTISLPGGGSGTPCVSSADFPSLSIDDSPNSIYKNNLYWFLYLPISIAGSCSNPYMVFFRSTDGGATWKDGQAFSASVYATDPMAVTNNGTLFIANENNGALYLYKSTDGGHSFSSTKLFSDSGLNSGPNQIVGASIVAGYGTNAVITFTSTIGGTLPEHLYAIYSLNNGLSWSSRVRIDDVVSPDNTQRPNRVSASMDMTNGHVDVAWYDSRNKNGAIGTGDVYYSYSNNTGLSFATNLRLTPNSGCIVQNCTTFAAGWDDFGVYSYSGYVQIVFPFDDTTQSISDSWSTIVTYRDFTFVGASSLQVKVGCSFPDTPILKSLGGFSGTVTVTASSGSPYASRTIAPSSVIVPVDQTNSTTITYSGNSVGSINITITATSGALSHSYVTVLNVVPHSACPQSPPHP